MTEDYESIGPTTLLRPDGSELAPPDAKLAGGTHTPDSNGFPRADIRQKSMISTENVPVLASKSPPITATIVVCTRNRPAELRSCLHAISQLERIPDEVLIIDNSNGNEETASVSREFGATCIVESIPGLSHARNRGMKESSSAIVVFLDDDAFPVKNWLGALLEPFSNPQIGLVTGAVVESSDLLPNHRKEMCVILNNSDPDWFEIAAYGGLGIGTNMAIRKDRCSGWTVFDERMGRGAPLEGMEEHHAFVRLVYRGSRAAHVPDAVVIHSSQRWADVTLEARNSFAYWLILFSEYPHHRKNLIRFLVRRLLHRPLGWHRESPDPGEIVDSGFLSLVKAGVTGVLLYLRNRKPKSK